MKKKYDFRRTEEKWQRTWQREGIYEPSLAKTPRNKKFYNLMMFPYPSAEGLHVGNMYAFTGSDIYGRFTRMRGYEVFEPIGLDGFGIHSENYAIKIGAHPMTQAAVSAKRFYQQLAAIGNGFAWKERLETYDPDYYRWTQWIFTRLFKAGLAYRKKQAVNWCPSCKTVLADEQVIAGKCERCSSEVIKKDLEQWFFRITAYADRLLKNLAKLDWTEKVKIAQRNWIGKSEGAEINFDIVTGSAPNFVLLHGYKGSPKKNFFPWLKKELESRGYRVQVPALPHPAGGNVAEQVEFVLRNAQFDSRTVLLGHSLGAVVAMRVAERLPSPIEKLVLAGGFVNPKFGDHSRAFAKTIDWQFDFDRIKRHVSEVRVLHDVNDPIVEMDRARELERAFGVSARFFEARDMHICGKKEPEVLNNILDRASIFTTRPDTLFGATYVVLAPEHPIVAAVSARVSNWREVVRYIEAAAKKRDDERVAEEKEKSGVELKGVAAVNPATGEKIPVWVADYVLGGYGTGAVMAVPAHDGRDLAFARKYGLPIRAVIEPVTGEPRDHEEFRRSIVAIVENPKTGNVLSINWGKALGGNLFVGGGREEGEDPRKTAEREIREETGYKNLKYAGNTETIHHHYIAHSKGVNRLIDAIGYHFLLIDEERDAPSLESDEKGKFTIEWITKEEAATKVSDHLHRLVFARLIRGEAYTGDGLLAGSGSFSGMSSEEAKWKIAAHVGGGKKIQYRLRDWLISRQRYWGPPIPMIHCAACAAKGRGERREMPGWYAVRDKDLPVKLPFVKEFRPTGKDESPLASVQSFHRVKCPACKSPARRETDVSDTFLDSAWYYLRYPSVRDKKAPWTPALTKKWLPVDMYIGGAEHSVLHLLYVRFMAMVLKDLKYIGFEEPSPTFRAHGLLIKDGAKMSKSKGNVVNPDEYIRKFGADVLRMYLMFLAPLEQGGDFRDGGILGVERFLHRVWHLAEGKVSTAKGAEKKEDVGTLKALHKAIKKVTEDIASLNYNTAISALMICLNAFETKGRIERSTFEAFLKLLAPFAPHITEELWREVLGHGSSIHRETWPRYRKGLLLDEVIALVVQINGKTRGTLSVPPDLGERELLALVRADSRLGALLGGNTPSRTIYVPGRLINILL